MRSRSGSQCRRSLEDVRCWDTRVSLLDVIKQIVLLSLANGLKCGLAGSLRIHQVTEDLGKVGPANAVLLLSQLCGFAVEVSLLRIQLVDGIAVKDALRVEVLVG